MLKFEPIPKPTACPWGPIETAREELPGIWWVTTGSHGGFVISQQRADAMPKVLRDARGYGSPLAFEEDCEWSLVVASFPTEFPPDVVAQARATIRGTARFDFPGFRQGVWNAAADYINGVN